MSRDAEPASAELSPARAAQPSRRLWRTVSIVGLVISLASMTVFFAPVGAPAAAAQMPNQAAQRVDANLAERLSEVGNARVAVLRMVGGEEVVEEVRVNDQADLDALLSDPSVVGVSRSDHVLERTLGDTVAVVGADGSHVNGAKGAGTTVAVIDSGIERTHPDLASSVVYEACFIEAPTGAGLCAGGQTSAFGPGSASDDDLGHGTLVAGVITGDGVVAPPGVAPDADVEIFKIFTATGGGNFFDLLRSLDHILDFRPDVDIINLSIGTDVNYTGTCDANYSVLYQLVEDLRARGTIVVAASGNEGTSMMGSPACLSNVISVAATTSNPSPGAVNSVTSFSNVSTTTDIAAPGDYVVTSFLGGSSLAVAGTSFATPVVAGCAALLIEVGNRTLNQLESRLLTSSTIATDSGGPGLPLVDCATGPPPTGDVNCDGVANIVDALLIAQLTVGMVLAAGECTLNPASLGVNSLVSDMNADNVVNILDALIVAQCTVQAFSPWCPWT